MMHSGNETPSQNRYYWIRFARQGTWAIGWWLERAWRCPATQERLGDVYEWADILTPDDVEAFGEQCHKEGVIWAKSTPHQKITRYTADGEIIVESQARADRPSVLRKIREMERRIVRLEQRSGGNDE